MKRPLRGPGLLVPAMLALCVSGVLGQPKAWESLGPEGGRVMAIAQDPTNANILLLAPYMYPTRIFRSTNRGVSWSDFSTVNDYVQDMAFDPKSGSIVYICATSAVYRSTTGGQTWTRNALPYATNAYYYAYSFAVDPVNTANIHVGCDVYNGSAWVPGYLRSTNSGTSWSGQMFGTDQGAFQGVTVDAVNPQYVYLGGYQYTGSSYLPKVYRSSNGGATFDDKSGTTLGGTYVYDIYADPVTANKVYAVSAGGVYRTTDAGSSWTPLGYVASPYRIGISKADPSLLYVASMAGYPFKSTNGGTSWTGVSSGINGGGYYAILVETGASPYVYFGNNTSVFRTTNNGSSWQSCCSGIKCASITALRTAPSAPATMFAAFLNNAVFKTTSASSPTVAWQQLPEFYSCISVEDFAISAANPDKLYAMEGGT